MKKYKKLIVIAIVLTIPLIAADGDLPADTLERVIGLTGLGGLIGIVLNLLKRFGVIKDGAAPTWNGIASLLIAAFMLAAPQFGLDVPWDTVDNSAALFTQVLQAVLGLVGIFGGARFQHFVLKDSFLGYSHS